METLETHEKIHEAAHHDGETHGGRLNKRIAILISVLACLLALIETGVNSTQNAYIAANIEASNLWAFFQAKSIRLTQMRTTADAVEYLLPSGLNAEQTADFRKRLAKMRADAQRYDSEPETGEGRKELAERAKSSEQRRDRALAAYHMFEYGAALIQIAIVMASAAAITSMVPLVFAAGGLGLVGVGFGCLGWFAPTLLHL
ncbi:MAG: DUF4337 domain-containing protein [Magnetococcales bacterium]|nr:DUF4337 domain-containing protein [Magnetococcales bacterium]